MPLQRDARVVVVDDDTFFVDAMLVLLPQLGLAPVACAMDGAEAVAVVREHDPDVVLVDLEMPFVDGVEAIKEISRISPNTTLLAVTGLTDPQRAADAVAAGALACLSKTDVRERLEALIAQHSLLVENCSVAGLGEPRRAARYRQSCAAQPGAARSRYRCFGQLANPPPETGTRAVERFRGVRTQSERRRFAQAGHELRMSRRRDWLLVEQARLSRGGGSSA